MKKTQLATLVCALSGLLLSGNVAAVTIVPSDSGTAFAVGTQSFYNETLDRVGGSAAATIPEFINLYFFPTADLNGLGISEGTLSFTVADNSPGAYSGTLQVEFVTSIATVPTQNGGNNSPSDQALLTLATQPATEIFNAAVAQGGSDTAILDAAIADGTIANDNNFLVFRFSDVLPAPVADQQSGITGVSLDLTTVPEPSAALLSAFAGLGLLVRRRR